MRISRPIPRIAALALWGILACSDSSLERQRDGLDFDNPAAPPLDGSGSIPGGGSDGNDGAAGTGPGPGGGSVAGGDGCGSISIDPMVTFGKGNLLVVFDRSMSMATPFMLGGTTTRLDEARNALKSALLPLVCDDVTDADGMVCVDDISVALLTFPTYDGVSGLDLTSQSCTVDNVDTDEQMNWQGLTDFYNNFDPYWMGRTLNPGDPLFPGMHPLHFGTPISVAFARADAALSNPAVMGNKAVLFLTDGEEVGICTDGVNAVDTAGKWYSEGIPTYVVSLAGPGFGQTFNDQVAMMGGTDRAIAPTDSQTLSEEIARIVMSTIGQTSCEVTIQNASLSDPLAACQQGEVLVGPTKVPCDQEAKQEGFFVKNENTIQVVGSYCDMLQRDQKLDARFPCTVLVL